jgi:hypothetical protein
MKKALLFLGLLSSVAQAQDCTKIFISEYVEGWSNNKALEIYNPSNVAVDLSEYFVARYSNGSASATVANAIQLNGTVPAKGVYVAVLDKRDPAGTGQEAPIWDSLEVRADGFYAPVYTTSNSFYWNGNDAIMLAKGVLPTTTTANVNTATGFQIIDVFGKIGENPLNENGGTSTPDGAWTNAFPYNNGQGVLVTRDHSLIRKSAVLKGVTANPSFFDPLLQYDSIPAVTYVIDANGDTLSGASGNPIQFGNWFSLGTHDCDCNDLGINDNSKEEIIIFPNPSVDGFVAVKGANTIKEIQIYNALGQYVGKAVHNAAATMTLKLGNDRGVYILRITQNDGSISSKRVVVK